MDVLDSKSLLELLRAMEQEIAKSHNEIRCARADLDKAQKRISFLSVLNHKLIERTKDQQNENKSNSQ